jgi:nicotinamide-nucleotide amidase
LFAADLGELLSSTGQVEKLAADVGALAQQAGITVAVAESVTAGHVATRLAAAPNASEWFRGGVVAYSAHAKFKLLGVPQGPLITPACASAMAQGVATLMDADITVALTGVGGPDPVEDHPPGTVWFGLLSRSGHHTTSQRFDGSVEQVLECAVEYALRMLCEQLQKEAGFSSKTEI